MSLATVAALFVRPDGPYANRPDVDAWDEARDARRYPGPLPVVAHPPCERWGNLWWAAQKTRAGPRPDAPGLGDDGGCFKSALASVRRWGGVLEHPEGSRAWAHFGLPTPEHGAGWIGSLFDDGWSCSVDQARYGHKARKRTWLYYVGAVPPPELDWKAGESSVWVCSGPGGRTAEERAAKGITLLSKREHSLTPAAFMDELLALARGCGGSGRSFLVRSQEAAFEAVVHTVKTLLVATQGTCGDVGGAVIRALDRASRP